MFCVCLLSLGTVQPNCADVLLRFCSLTHSFLRGSPVLDSMFCEFSGKGSVFSVARVVCQIAWSCGDVQLTCWLDHVFGSDLTLPEWCMFTVGVKEPLRG